MRDSWETGRFWFNYAARKSLDVDELYWHKLYEGGASVEEMNKEIGPFIDMKMKKLREYKEEYTTRFS